jgi:hypothetical protein
MSYWLHGMLPRQSTRDMILQRIKAVLAASPVILGAIGGPDHLVRRSAYVPFATTLTPMPVLILAPMALSEEPRLSGVIKAEFEVGVMLEFEDFEASIPDGEPSADTLLEEVQRTLEANPLLLLSGEKGEDNPCSIARLLWASVQPGAKEGAQSTTYYVGLVAKYEFRESYGTRKTGIDGTFG